MGGNTPNKQMNCEAEYTDFAFSETGQLVLHISGGVHIEEITGRR